MNKKASQSLEINLNSFERFRTKFAAPLIYWSLNCDPFKGGNG